MHAREGILCVLVQDHIGFKEMLHYWDRTAYVARFEPRWDLTIVSQVEIL